MKVTTTQVTELTAKETGDILCRTMAENSSDLGKIKSGHAEDMDGLAAKVTLVFENEGK